MRKNARENCGSDDDEQYMQIKNIFIQKKGWKSVCLFFFDDAIYKHGNRVHNLFE